MYYVEIENIQSWIFQKDNKEINQNLTNLQIEKIYSFKKIDVFWENSSFIDQLVNIQIALVFFISQPVSHFDLSKNWNKIKFWAEKYGKEKSLALKLFSEIWELNSPMVGNYHPPHKTTTK